MEKNETPPSERFRGLAFGKGCIEYCAPEALRPYSGNARTHDEEQIKVLMGSIRGFGFINPVLIDKDGVIVAGHGRVEAARRLGMTEIPVLRIEALTPDELRAYRLADNRIAELAGWDSEILAIELQHLSEVELDFGIEVTGWTNVEIDAAILDGKADEEEDADPADAVPAVGKIAVSRLGDMWLMGKHRLLCGSALEASSFNRLLGDEKAVLICQDPPWNIAVKSISGSGKTQHREFLMASGEMSDEEYRAFIETQLARNIECAVPGAVIQSFIDWRGVEKVITAGISLGLELLNVLVWHKGHGSFGSPWRSAHELIVCFKVPSAPIKDRVRMGKHGRIRSNVLEVPGMGSFGKGRMEALESHPTSKPVALVTELIRDVTDRGDIVLDSFMGSGSCLLSADRSGRIARGIELDPLYVDVIVRRWQDHTGEDAILEGDGRSFAEIAEARGEAAECSSAEHEAPSAHGANGEDAHPVRGAGRIRRYARASLASGAGEVGHG